jgi:hypothetical protein
VTVVRRLVRPLSLELPDEELALAIEARSPALRDRLISALQFSEQLRDPENEESPELIGAVLDEAAGLAREGMLATSTTSRRAWPFAAAGAGLLLVVLGVGFSSPNLASIWLQRALLGDVPWPRATTLRVLDLATDQPIVVTRGDDLTVVVEAIGKVPEDVRIHYRQTEGGRAEDTRRMYRLPETENRFQYEFREIPRSFSFSVTGGDDDDEEPVFTVRALVPPSVESISARCVFPPYTGRAEEVIPVGDFEVPVGTRVNLSISTNMPVRRAHLTREGADPTPLTPRTIRRYETTFEVGQSYRYAIELEGLEGQRNRVDRDTYRITAVPDRRPEVRVLTPSARELFAPGALLPLKVLATDNYGLASLTLLHRLGADAPEQTISIREGSNLGQEVVAFFPLEVADLRNPDGRPPRAEDRILLQVVGVDNNGLEDRTDVVQIEIAAPEEVERRLGQRQIALKEDASGARAIQKESRRAVEQLATGLAPGGERERAFIDRLRDAQIIQGRVGRKMEEFQGGIQRVLNAYVFNRLGNPVAGDFLLRLYREELGRDREDLSRVFKPRLYARIVEAQIRREFFDPEVLGILVQIVGVSSEISGNLSPRAHRLISEVVRGEAEDPAATLRAVLEVQDACLASFDSLMTMMKRWETYHEFVIRLRELEDLQRSITERARQALQPR